MLLWGGLLSYELLSIGGVTQTDFKEGITNTGSTIF